jgi:uncharacterized membrane protein (UPF0127 family)
MRSSLGRLIGSALVALFFCVSGLVQAAERIYEPLRIVTAGGTPHDFRVELADTAEERAVGLMERREMGPDEGMLFDFGVTRQVYMWMKDTYIPLDMLFISETGTVLNIRRNAEPLSEAIIDSGDPVHYVLELNSGVTEELGIGIGDRVESSHIPAAAK